ncbi:hypothetical protein [Flagellimonas meishanensis]|uniref:hypothetical protein n=1 Tax=Flagellimonas meishanensis TaxID=2873264 RepID=UPI001CA6FBB5|nr:hypothetical protein [[Muricauda] meishanensis]
MKEIWKRLFLLLILALAMFATSCREEESVLIESPPGETLEANSSIAGLLRNTAAKDGSDDNIIDNASCISIELPVTVMVDGLEIIVDSQSDFDTIEDIFDEFDDDDDVLEIVFPITIILNDFSEVVIADQDELESFTDDCSGENEIDDDIECADIKYPVTASVFNSNNEIIDTISLSSDEQLYKFIDDLDEDDIVNVNFPITVILFDGTEVQASNLDDLENILENAKDDCDEDDDNDFNDDDCDNCTTDQLSDVLTGCSDWWVDKLERNDQDLEDLYTGYSFNFLVDGTLSAVSSTDSFSGTWETSGSGNSIAVVVNIPNLTDFNATWNLHEIEQNSSESDVDLRLGDDRLRFRTNCASSGGGGTVGVDDTALIQVLTTGDWYVTNYFDDVDETALFDGMVFNFADDGSATANNAGTITNGTWATGSGDETDLELNLNFGMNVPFDELMEDWDVLEATNDIIRLKDISGGDGTTDFLTFERNPSSNGNGGVDLSTIIVDGTWTISSYLDDGIDETANFSAFTFNFDGSGTVVADNGSITNGTWSVQNGDNKFVLDFGAAMPLDEFNDDWDVISVTDTQLELRDVSGGGGGTDTLIFTKQ